MWFQFVSCNQFILTILCLTTSWLVCEGAAQFFKGSDQVTQIVNATDGAKETRLPCRVKLESAKNRWYKNGQLIDYKSDRYRVKKNRYLKIRNVRKSDRGIYICQAYNAEGSAKKTIYLNVIEENSSGPGVKPFFTHPEEMKKEQEYSEDPHVFVCKATGIPKPDVMWFKNNELIPHKAGEITSDNFLLKVKSPEAKGPIIKYKCLVWNKVGNISYEFILNFPAFLRAAPIIQQFDNQTAVVGTQFQVTCKAASQKEPVFNLKQVLPNGSVVPVKIGGNIKKGPVIRMDTDLLWYSVTWTYENVSFSDQKMYACAAKNFFSVKKESFFLTVIPKEDPTNDSPTRNHVNDSQDKATDIIIIAAVTGTTCVIVLVIVVCAMCLIKRRQARGTRFVPSKRDVVENYYIPS